MVRTRIPNALNTTITSPCPEHSRDAVLPEAVLSVISICAP